MALAALLHNSNGTLLTKVSLDARVQLLQIVNVLAEDLHVLQAVLSSGSPSEGQNSCAALQPPHMHLCKD